MKSADVRGRTATTRTSAWRLRSLQTEVALATEVALPKSSRGSTSETLTTIKLTGGPVSKQIVGYYDSYQQEPCYRRDHRAMRPIYECPDNNVSAKLADDCVRISTLQSYHYSAVKLFSKYSIQCDHGT